MQRLNQYIIITLFSICLISPALAQQNKFVSEGYSRQYNIPDNKGTVNINQYLIKFDVYQMLTNNIERLVKDLSEKRADCSAFEASGNTESEVLPNFRTG